MPAAAEPETAAANRRRAHVEVGNVHIQRRVVDENARHQCHDVAGLIVQVPGLEHGEAREQCLSLDFRETVGARLLARVC